MIKDTVICASCGATNPMTSNFCSSCGSVIVKKKACAVCGTEHDPKARFCSNCGSSLISAPKVQPTATPSVSAATPKVQPTAAPSVSAATPKVQPIAVPSVRAYAPSAQYAPIPEVAPPVVKAPRKPSNFSLINKAVLLILSAMLFAFSFFPVLTYTARVDREDFTLKFSALDAIVFASDNFYSLDYEDLEDTALYTRYSDVAEEFYDAKNDEAAKEAFSKLQKLYYRLSLRSDTTPLMPNTILAAIFSVIYITVAFSCFVMSASAFFSALGGRKTSAKPALKLLLFTPFIALIANFALTRSLSSYMLMINNAFDTTFEAGVGATVIGLLTVGALTVILLLQSMTANRKTFSFAKTVFSLITLAIIGAAVVFCNTDVLTMNVKTEFQGKEVKTGVEMNLTSEIYDHIASFSDEYNKELSKSFSDKEEKSAYINQEIEDYSAYSLKEAKNGEAKSVTNRVVYDLLVCWNRNVVRTFSLASAVFTLLFAFLILIFAMTLSSLCSLKTKSSLSVVLSIFSLLLAAGAFAINYLLVLTLQKSISYYSLKSTLRISIPENFVILVGLVVLSLLFVSILAAINKRNKRFDY